MNTYPKTSGLDQPSQDDGPSTSKTDDDEIEEDIASISEQISFEDSHNDPSSNEVLQIGAQVTAKKRQLFAFSDDEDDAGDDGPIFKMDDSMLDGRRIADHFRAEVESEADDEPAELDSLDGHVDAKDDSIGSNRENEPPGNEDSAHQISSPNIETNVGTSHKNRHSSSQKEISPFHDDVILLNNDKISLTSLKNSQLPLPALKLPPLKVVSPQPDENPSSATTTNQNTTNDISDIGRDDTDEWSLSYLADPNIQRRVQNSKSLDEYKGKAKDVVVPNRSLHSSFKFAEDRKSSKPVDESDGEASKNSSYEADQSVDELLFSNTSIVAEKTETDHTELQLNTPRGATMNNEVVPVMDHLLLDSIVADSSVGPVVTMVDDSLEYVSDGISDFKDRILAASVTHEESEDTVQISSPAEENDIEIKQMIKVDMSKEALEDISETTEPSYDVTLNADKNLLQKHNSSKIDSLNESKVANETNDDSVISLNMMLAYEERIKDLEQIVTAKDVCIEALNLQQSRRESLKDGVCESCSMVTSSTEYRTYQDECFPNKHDLNQEIIERENLIEQLTDSLQQSLQVRDQLQAQSDRLTSEVTLLRKQLADTTEIVRRPLWIRDDPELVGGGQRISEISIDLVSDSDADDMQEKARTQNHPEAVDSCIETKDMESDSTAENLIDSFQRSLSPEDLAIFTKLKTSFADYVQLELGTMQLKSENELKILSENLLTEKQDKELEVNELC